MTLTASSASSEAKVKVREAAPGSGMVSPAACPHWLSLPSDDIAHNVKYSYSFISSLINMISYMIIDLFKCHSSLKIIELQCVDVFQIVF